MTGSGTVSTAGLLVALVAPSADVTTTRYCSPLFDAFSSPLKERVLDVAPLMLEKPLLEPLPCFCHWYETLAPDDEDADTVKLANPFTDVVLAGLD
jgi:hypothetical protein